MDSSLLSQQQQQQPPPTPHTSNSDFPIAIAVLAILALAILLVSYYIFVTKCCISWHTFDPLRRFSISRTPRDEGSIISFSPMLGPIHHRGLDEFLLNNIPTMQYKPNNQNFNKNNLGRSFRGCAVCLNEFEEKEMLRVLPRCNHTFHLDCIDVWLLNNASCPLCRSNISGRTKYPLDHIIAPSSSPQDLISPMYSGNLSMISFNGDDQDYLVIEIGDEDATQPSSTQRKNEHNTKLLSRKKLHNFSIMGDECINIGHKDEQFAVQQPIRRSFSMDSAADRGLILQVQEIVRQNHMQLYCNNNNNNNNEVSSSTSASIHEECNNNNNSVSGRIRRSSFFSFRHGRGRSRSSSILPIECDQ